MLTFLDIYDIPNLDTAWSDSNSRKDWLTTVHGIELIGLRNRSYDSRCVKYLAMRNIFLKHLKLESQNHIERCIDNNSLNTLQTISCKLATLEINFKDLCSIQGISNLFQHCRNTILGMSNQIFCKQLVKTVPI